MSNKTPVAATGSRRFPVRALLLAGAPLLLLLAMMGSLRLLDRMEEAAMARAGAAGAPRPALPPPSPPRPVEDATQKKMETAIRGQLMAIKKQDYEKAMQFSSMSFRSEMPPDKFGEMIESGYMEMQEFDKIEFDRASVVRGVAFMNVSLSGLGSYKTIYMYSLVSEENKWRIISCTAVAQVPKKPRTKPSPPSSREKPE
ncbi:MAG: hypothetical protein OHK0029_17820 [Armatimonadaceae bacterium]